MPTVETMRSATPPTNRPARACVSDPFSTSIIHDIRNPLAVICASAEMLTDPHLTRDHTLRLGRTINKAAGRMRELLADLAGIMQGRIAVVESCRLDKILAAACEDTAIAAARQGVEIVVD